MDEKSMFISFPSIDSWRCSQTRVNDEALWNVRACPSSVINNSFLRKLDSSQDWFPQMISTIHERAKLLVATSNSHETGHVELRTLIQHDDLHCIFKHSNGLGLGFWRLGDAVALKHGLWHEWQ
jgi:hypothetical protein